MSAADHFFKIAYVPGTLPHKVNSALEVLGWVFVCACACMLLGLTAFAPYKHHFLVPLASVVGICIVLNVFGTLVLCFVPNNVSASGSDPESADVHDACDSGTMSQESQMALLMPLLKEVLAGLWTARLIGSDMHAELQRLFEGYERAPTGSSGRACGARAAASIYNFLLVLAQMRADGHDGVLRAKGDEFLREARPALLEIRELTSAPDAQVIIDSLLATSDIHSA